MKEYDVIVVGAGPAGSTTARLCARKGYSTLLLDKDRFPRHKPCGGALSLRALTQLDFDITKIAHETYLEAKIFRPKGDYLLLQSKKPFAIGTSRLELDHILAQRAVLDGAVFRDNEKVAKLRVTSKNINVECESGFQAIGGILVGADGANSTVAIQANLRKRWSTTDVALCVVSETRLGRENVTKISPTHALEFHIGIVPAGYGWMFPKGENISVGVGCLLSELKDAKHLFSDFVMKDQRLKSLQLSQPEYHLIPLGGIQRNISTNRIILTGDAAGFVDPLVADGISYALKSGIAAAQSIDKALGSGNVSALVELYVETCETLFLEDLRYAYSLAKKVYTHPNFVLGLFKADDKLRKKFIEVLQSKSSYKDLIQVLYKRLPLSMAKTLIRKPKI